MNEEFGNVEEPESESEIDEDVADDDYQELVERVERAEQLLIQERNRRVFERAAEKSGIRSDRLDAAAKLAGIDAADETLDDNTALKIAQKILAEYPEFSQKRSPLTTDQGVPSDRKSRAVASGDALALLRAMRRK